MICARRFVRCLALLAFSALLTLALPAQTVDTIDPALRGRIDRIAAQVLEQTGVPSASVAVVKGGKLVYRHAYGKARLKPAKAATPEMRYSIGSISKQFTAAAILLLQEEGKLSLDDPVGKYVPGLTRGDEVTIREILSHTSGYQDYWPEDYVMTTIVSGQPSRRAQRPHKPRGRAGSERQVNLKLTYV
ncbi:MAG: beta-lactamase family protein [Acidobacteriota bacterium]|nr:beta-lactamase family protein [Acidobacteriota bacterium]